MQLLRNLVLSPSAWCRVAAAEGREGGRWVVAEQPPLSFAGLLRQLRAEARLTRDGAGMTGRGLARRNPDDQQVTQIGEEIAAARALSDLAHQLLGDAAGQIEGITHQRAHLSL